MEGMWTADDVPDGSIIRMRFDYKMKYGPLGRLLDRLFVRRLFQKTCDKLLDNWEKRIVGVGGHR